MRQRVYGLDIRQGTFEEVSLPLGTFDLVTALRVLEHVADPRGLLTQVKTLLKPSGWLYLEVPNVWRPRHHPAEFLGVQHLRLFTRSSLLNLLGQVGFVPRAMDDEGSGLRALFQPTTEDGIHGAAIEQINHPLLQARGTSLVFLKYQIAYLWQSTIKSRVRRSLDRLLGPQPASTLVAWGKRALGKGIT